jgi:hypothetical protein
VGNSATSWPVDVSVYLRWPLICYTLISVCFAPLGVVVLTAEARRK